MDLVNLLLLAGACSDAISALCGKTYEQAWGSAGTRDGWREWARACGSGYGSGYGSGHGTDLEIWHDGAWRGIEWARSEIALLVAKMK